MLRSKCTPRDVLNFSVFLSVSHHEQHETTPFFYRWNEETFGPHFSASPVEGIVAPLTETGIEVVFTPKNVDDDIRREGVLCMVEVRARRATYVPCITCGRSSQGSCATAFSQDSAILTPGLSSSFDPFCTRFFFWHPSGAVSTAQALGMCF